MPTTRTTLVLAGGALVLGIGAGVATQPTQPAPETHTEFIKVPEYKTRVVEKEVPVKSTVTTPLPDSCREAVRLLPAVVAESDIQTSAAGKIRLALSDLGTGVATPDIHLINQASGIVRRQRDRLGSAVIHQHLALNDLNSALAECDKDLGE